MAEQLTQAEKMALEAIRKVCEAGYGQVTINIHRGQVKDVVRSETEKLHIDAA